MPLKLSAKLTTRRTTVRRRARRNVYKSTFHFVSRILHLNPFSPTRGRCLTQQPLIFIFRATNLPQNKLCYTLCKALETVFATLIENLYSSIFINKSSANYYILLLLFCKDVKLLIIKQPRQINVKAVCMFNYLSLLYSCSYKTCCFKILIVASDYVINI